MIFRLYHEHAGAHVHCRLFAGKHDGALGKCGDFTMRNTEFASLVDACPMIDYSPPYPKGNSFGAKDIAAQIAESVALKLTEDQRTDLESAVATAVQQSFDMGVRSVGGEVLDFKTDNAEVPDQIRAVSFSGKIAADWFTLPPTMRTKARLIEMLNRNGEYR